MNFSKPLFAYCSIGWETIEETRLNRKERPISLSTKQIFSASNLIGSICVQSHCLRLLSLLSQCWPSQAESRHHTQVLACSLISSPMNLFSLETWYGNMQQDCFLFGLFSCRIDFPIRHGAAIPIDSLDMVRSTRCLLGCRTEEIRWFSLAGVALAFFQVEAVPTDRVSQRVFCLRGTSASLASNSKGASSITPYHQETI